MACRIIHAFGSGVCEACKNSLITLRCTFTDNKPQNTVPVQLVNDIFFLHERGLRIGYYTSMSYYV